MEDFCGDIHEAQKSPERACFRSSFGDRLRLRHGTQCKVNLEMQDKSEVALRSLVHKKLGH